MAVQKAPLFTLKDRKGRKVRLADIDKDYIVIYFYPKDSTPGCTVEAKEFSEYLPRFRRLGCEVIGISGGDEESKEKFASKHKLKVTLLSDPDFKVAQKYGAYGTKRFMGKTFKGILRKTFVLDRGKRIIKVFDKVKPRGHAKEVYEFIKQHKRV